MNDQYQYLLNNYPTVYSAGVRCGVYFPEEWLTLIEELSKNIADEIAASNISGFRVDQIKEKFGGLRFYVTNSNDKIDSLIFEAEEKVYEFEKNLKHKDEN